MPKFVVWNKMYDRPATPEEISELSVMEEWSVWEHGDHCTLECGDDDFEIRDYSPTEKGEK